MKLPPDAVSLDRCAMHELPLVQSLAERIWRAHYPGIITDEQIDYMLARGYTLRALARFVETDGAGLVIARVDGLPSGFVAWYRADEPATTKLDRLYVLPERQGAGLGRHLIAHVEAAARAAGHRLLVLNVNKHNAGSIAAYERCGFRVREAVVVDIGNGFVMDDYVMEKAMGDRR